MAESSGAEVIFFDTELSKLLLGEPGSGMWMSWTASCSWGFDTGEYELAILIAKGANDKRVTIAAGA